MRDPLRFLALWALLHERADDAWKGAVARGRHDESAGKAAGEAASEAAGPDALSDALAALVDDEKERLSRELLGSSDGSNADVASLAASVDRLAFELAEVRGLLESLQTSVDALLDRPEA